MFFLYLPCMFTFSTEEEPVPLAAVITTTGDSLGSLTTTCNAANTHTPVKISFDHFVKTPHIIYPFCDDLFLLYKKSPAAAEQKKNDTFSEAPSHSKELQPKVFLSNLWSARVWNSATLCRESWFFSSSHFLWIYINNFSLGSSRYTTRLRVIEFHL